jgi:hypothetical protein
MRAISAVWSGLLPSALAKVEAQAQLGQRFDKLKHLALNADLA